MSNQPSELGKRLSHSRKQQGLTRVDLAKQVKVSPEALRRIEMGQTRSPGVYLVAQLAEILGISPLYLLYGEKQEAPAEDRRGIRFTQVHETSWVVKFSLAIDLPEHQRECLAQRLAFECDLLLSGLEQSKSSSQATRE